MHGKTEKHTGTHLQRGKIMNFTKLLALILSVIMLASAFSSCGKKEIEEKKDDGEKDIPSEITDDDEYKKELVISNGFYPTYNPDEYKKMRKVLREWLVEKLEKDELFSAKLGGRELSEIIKTNSDNKKLGISKDTDGNEVFRLTATDFESQVEFTLIAVLYSDYPAVDITAYAENKGDKPSPIISSFNAVDAEFPLESNRGYEINTTVGSNSQANDFEPVKKAISNGKNETVFEAVNGRSSSDNAWPYFDVIGKNEGILLSVGWSGSWQAGFANRNTGLVNVRVSQKTLEASLLPGEKIRTPKAVILYFTGDAEYGHNLQRRLIVEHYTTDDGTEKRFVSPITTNFWGGLTSSYINKTTKIYADAGVKFDAMWLDAGWYGDYERKPEGVSTALGSNGLGWYDEVGWWTVNKKLFPTGSLSEITKTAHDNGYKFLLWCMFEEGMEKLGDKLTLGKDSFYDVKAPNGRGVLRLDRDDVFDKAKSLLKGKIEKDGIDWLRIDYGSTPYKAWIDNDEKRAVTEGVEKRLGITENKYITNLYRMFDELSSEYPGFMLDNCAGGGRRLDIELYSRSFVMWRTDYTAKDLEAMQTQTEWLSYWLPFSGIGVVSPSENSYSYRSLLSSSAAFTTSASVSGNIDKLKEIFEEFSNLRPYFYGDYYQILEPSLGNDNWQCYELFRDDWQKGIVVVIRRQMSSADSSKIKIKGLFEGESYRVHDIDDIECKNDFVQSSEKLEKGINITVPAGCIKIYEVSHYDKSMESKIQ